MKISGLVKSSLIDYPGKVAAVVFTQGCNFRCGFCHNPDLVIIKNKTEISEGDVLNFLAGRKGRLDGVVITGGEPTIQKDLPVFIKKIKDLGFLVKLDTNGSDPKMLGDLILNKQIDYVAMDIKSSIDKYKYISGYSGINNIKKSIKIIIDSDVDYEFRTTVLPYYHKMSDFKEIGKMIQGANRYTIQGFRSENVLDKKLIGAKTFTKNELDEIKTILEKYINKVLVRDNL